MDKFYCNDNYKECFDEYTKKVLKRFGFSSESAQREIVCIANAGNVVAKKTYADFLFYKKILRKNAYRDAFFMYLEAADISVGDDGELKCAGNGYPLAFWPIGYYLVNYRCESILLKCETIDVIENMPRTLRLKAALEMAAQCMLCIDTPGALNLIGRILIEASESESLFNELLPLINEVLSYEFCENVGLIRKISTKAECRSSGDAFFRAAADNGYVYSCNNLASREALAITDAQKAEDACDEALQREIDKHVDAYVHYLTQSADRYEPYAANKLGLFYMTGEVKAAGSKQKVYFKKRIDTALAKEYFTKATVFPDANSAWAYFNLIKYFARDYKQNLDLMNEHMGYIKELNPEVYNIAIEL